MNHRSIFLCALLLLVGSTKTDSKRLSRHAPTHFFVIGDRFSGVEYLTDLLNRAEGLNLKQCQIAPNIDSDWKFGFFTARELEQNLDCNLEKTVVIMVSKDPFAWLFSVAKRKFPSGVTSLHTLALVSNRFVDTINLNAGSGKISTTNIIKLRTRKLKSYISIMRKSLRHTSRIRYEDLLHNPEKTVKEALRGKGLLGSFNMTSSIQNVINLDKREFYLKKEYLKDFSDKAIDRSINKLDKNLEKKLLGYDIPPINDWVTPKQQIRKKKGYMPCIYVLVDVIQWIIVVTIALMILSLLIVFYRDMKQYLCSVYCKIRSYISKQHGRMHRENQSKKFT